MQSAIPIFNSFSTFFQATEPLIHVLDESTFQSTDSSNDLDSTDIYEEENLKDLNNIYIGQMTKQFAGENDLIVAARYRKCLSESRKVCKVRNVQKRNIKKVH